MSASPLVVICSSEKDKIVSELLLKHLETRFSPGEVQLLSGDLPPGATRKAIDKASVMVLLTSVDYLGQEKANERELIKKRASGYAIKVFRISARPCSGIGNDAWMKNVQLLGNPDKSLAELEEAECEKELDKAAEVIRNVVKPTAQKQTYSSMMVPKVNKDRLPQIGSHFVGRQEELKKLDEAWKTPQTRIFSVTGCGGEGKTALVKSWLLQMEKDRYRGAQQVLAWCFNDDRSDPSSPVMEFFRFAFSKFEEDASTYAPGEIGSKLAELICEHTTLLILDGLEGLQNPAREECGWLKADARDILDLLSNLANRRQPPKNEGLCIVTSREPIKDLAERQIDTCPLLRLEGLADETAENFLRDELKVAGDEEEMRLAVSETRGHALSLNVLGEQLKSFDGNVASRDRIRWTDNRSDSIRQVSRMLKSYDVWYDNAPELTVLNLLALFPGPTERSLLDRVQEERIAGLSVSDSYQWKQAIQSLNENGLIWNATGSVGEPMLAVLPMVREHFANHLARVMTSSSQQAHEFLAEHFGRSILSNNSAFDSFEKMKPVFRATRHRRHAGQHAEAAKFYVNHIHPLRGGPIEKLLDSEEKTAARLWDLQTLALFYEDLWNRPDPKLADNQAKWFRGHGAEKAGDHLKALGRDIEKREAYNAAIVAFTAATDWDKVQEVKDKRDLRSK